MNDLALVELHLHLEGAAPAAFIRGLAREKNIDIGGIFDAHGAYAFRNFVDFLRVYEAASSVLTSPEDYARLTRAVLEEAAENGVVYCETFLSPDFCGGRDLGAWREYLEAIRQAAATAEHDMGVTLRGIVTCIRHFGPDVAREVALCAAETASDWLLGFGMAGDENRGQPRDFAWSFDMAREAGLRLTAHAGEWRGPEAIRATLRDLRVERIGHGVRAIEDLVLVEELAEAGTVLELCPGSNIALGLYPGWCAHPIVELYRRGVAVTVSTDDPPFFRTSMRQEFERLHAVFEGDAAALHKINGTALDAAFCDADTREKIAKLMEARHA